MGISMFNCNLCGNSTFFIDRSMCIKCADEMDAHSDAVSKLLIKIAIAAKKGAGTRLSAQEIATLNLTSWGEDAALAYEYTKEANGKD